MKTFKVYTQIENRLKVLGLSYTALKFLIAPTIFFAMLFLGLALSGYLLISLICPVLIGIAYFVVRFMDMNKTIARMFDKTIPSEITNDSLYETQYSFSNTSNKKQRHIF